MSLKLSINSFDRRFLTGILALIFLLTMILSDVTLSQESQAGKEEVLRKASLRWMQVGIKQYKSDLFTEAELSFRRARVFKKYLTDAERQELNEFLANARTAISEGKQAVANTKPADESIEQAEPVKAEVNVEKVKVSEPATEKQLDKISDQPGPQEVQSVKTAEPSVSKIQLAAESSPDVIVVKNESFRAKFMRLSDWLLQNRRNILMIGLPALAVLVLISKLQGIRIRPGRSVYANHVPANISFIGSKLNSNDGNNRPSKGLGKRRLAFAAAPGPERKSFEQSTEHWKEKHANHAPAAVKPVRTDEEWPQRKDKPQAGDSVVAKAGQKRCRKCNELKALSDFHKNKSSKDGLASWCKECKKQSRKKSV